MSSLWRENFVGIAVGLLFVVLAGRLVQLHSEAGDELSQTATRQRLLQETVPARPGDILDRAGRVFATSVMVRSVYVVPSRILDVGPTAERLAVALNLDPTQLERQIAGHAQQQFFWVKRRIGETEADAVRNLKLPAGTWGFREEFRRSYPMGALAAHVIGLRSIDGVGQGGVEQHYDATLRGHDGVRELVRDARGRVIEVREEASVAPQHGQHVQLTIDARLQTFVDRALDDLTARWKPESACAVVLDPRTGDVLALGSRPGFDPNQPNHVPEAAWKNNALCSIYEPGSTFKPFVVAWALQEKVIQRDELFNCEHGEYRMGKRLLHDHHPYGDLSVTDILVKSSNIGMAKIGQRLGNARLYDAAVSFGFGGKTGIDLPGELSGILRPLSEWTSYSTGSIPMGQELSTTPLQIIAAFAALANGGRLITPHVLHKVLEQKATGPQHHHHESAEGLGGIPLAIMKADGPEGAGGVVSETTIHIDVATWVRTQALTAVVERGTGKRARLPGYSVFGKTGTAQKLNPHGGYSDDRHISSFVCGAPADNPRVLVIVSVDDPRAASRAETFGGSVAAPTAAAILEKTLKQLGVPAGAQTARAIEDETDDVSVD